MNRFADVVLRRSAFIGLLLLAATASSLQAAGTTIMVNDSGDTLHNMSGGNDCADLGTGTCTLRDAITFANLTGAMGEPYTVDFSGLPAPLITITGGLPDINQKMIIDGSTKPPKVTLDGSGAGPADGLRVNAQSTISNMVIEGFGGDGIVVETGGSLSLLLSNFIGTDPTGEIAVGNGTNGITVNATLVQVISNVISGNGQAGLDIEGSFLPVANAVSVQNNKIGTDMTGLLALGNTSHGIWIRIGANANVIGGGNVVSGNGGHGIFIDGSSFPPFGNIVSGNFIGTRIGGLGAIANSLDGIHIDNSSDNVIGGPPFGANFISGNTGNGVMVNDSDGNQIFGNLIGLDSAGIAGADGNGGDGIFIKTSTNTTVGGTLGIVSRNVISSNTLAGVHISGQVGTTTGNVIEGNFVGTNIVASDTSNTRPNGTGVFIEGSSAVDNTIGGSGSSNANTIAFNTGLGVQIGLNSSDDVGHTVILSNSIHDNGGLGIDLGNDGVTANDAGDTDFGPNNFQNFPVLTLALLSHDGSKILMKGSQDSAVAPNQIQFFLALDSPPDPSGHGEGQTLILDQSGVGNGSFTFGPSAPASAVTAGNLASSTATTTDGTSEFSADIPFVQNQLPIANAGPNQPSVMTGATVVLDGSASSDPDGLPNGPTIANGNFTWTRSGGTGPAVVLTNPTSANPSFVAAFPGTYIFSLVVSDGMDVSTNSAVVTITVMSTTTTVLVSNINPSAFGQAVTFTATVTGAGGTPTGTVTFLDNGSMIGTGTLNGSGVATFTTSVLAVGTHPITAVYGGDSDFLGSTSNLVNQVVSQDSTTTAVVSSVNPSVFGQSVTFTATVTAVPPGSGTPGGAVTFFDGGTMLGAGPVPLSGGVAMFTTAALAVGTHPITAVYGGDSSFTGSTSPIVSQVVDQAATTTALISSVNPSLVGQSVMFTATVTPVAPGAGTPTGTVNFLDNGSMIGSGMLDGTGHASFTTSMLTQGSHPITAVYVGDTDFTTSTSPILTQVVNATGGTPSATALVSSLNPSVFGQAVTFTATVTGSGATPTGMVTFFDNGSMLGTGMLNGGAVATFTTSLLAVGTHPITAMYAGDATYAPSTSPIVSQVVDQAATTTALISSVNPSLVGQSVMFTATVTPVAPGAGTPTGTVNFLDNGSMIGSGMLDGTGHATFTTSMLTQGSHPITAVYVGDTDFTTSTSPILTQVVNATGGTPSATALVSSLNPSVFGQAVTFTATVTGSGATPTGMVTFFDNGSMLGTGMLNGGAVATFTTSLLAVGTHPITAMYAGDATYAPSTSPIVSQVVDQAATTTALISSVNPSLVGQSVMFTATVTPVAPGAGTPTGTVNFLDNGSMIGSGMLDGTGHASFTTSMLTQGSHPITAVYVGDTDFTTSTSPILTQVVNATGGTPSATALVSSVNPSVFGQAVTFTATVTGSGATPTGMVTFFDNGSMLGTGVLNGGAVATFTTSLLAVGTHPITAMYAGDATYAPSTSPIVNQVVNTASGTPSATALVSSLNPSVFGQSVTFTATVTGGPPTPTGTVTFLDNGSLLGTGMLNGAGVATLTTSALAVGTHPITAVYGGDATFAPSTSPVVNQVVTAGSGLPSATALVSSLNPSNFGQSVTFTATVTGGPPTPTGTVTFSDNGVPLGTVTLNGAGVATLTTSLLAVGSHPITAVYNGDATFAGSTSPVLIQVVNGGVVAAGIPAIDSRGIAALVLLLAGVGVWMAKRHV